MGGTVSCVPLIAPQQVNLRIPNPLNIRMAGQNLLQGQRAAANTRGPIVMATTMRPANAQVIGQMLPSGGAQMLTAGGATLLPQGARLVAPQHAILTNRLPLRPNFQAARANQPLLQGQVTSSTMSLPLQMTAVPAQGTMATIRALAPLQAGYTSSIPTQAVSLANAQVLTSMAVTALPAGAVSLASGTAVTLTPVSTTTPVSVATSADSSTTTPTPSSTTTTTTPAAPATDSPTPTKSDGSGDQKKAGPSQEEAGVDLSKLGVGAAGDGDFDPAKAMEWENGIGKLPGSDLKVNWRERGGKLMNVHV